MNKVRIELNEGWRFWPVLDDNAGNSSKVITLSDEFLAEWELVSIQFEKMQVYLEHCFRHQEDLTPLHDSPFAETDEE